MSGEFTSKETKWIKDADRLFKRIPRALRLYVCDSTIEVCKLGQPCDEVTSSISGSIIECCCVVSDVHDDMNYGRN